MKARLIEIIFIIGWWIEKSISTFFITKNEPPGASGRFLVDHTLRLVAKSQQKTTIASSYSYPKNLDANKRHVI